MAVYMAEVDGIDAVKIGFSRNVAKRMQSLQGSHIGTVRCLRVLDGDQQDEARLLRQFKHLLIRGEWVKRDPALFGDLGLRDLEVPEVQERHGRSRDWARTPEYRKRISDVMLARNAQRRAKTVEASPRDAIPFAPRGCDDQSPSAGVTVAAHTDDSGASACPRLASGLRNSVGSFPCRA